MNTKAESTYGWNSKMPMNLLEKLRADLKAAMMAKDNTGRNTIRQVMSEFPALTVPLTLESGKKTSRPKKPEEITDDDIVDIIRKLVKAEKTVLAIKAETGSDYLAILESYLPKMADAGEIEAWIASNVDLSGIKSPMQAMGPVMKHFGKRADGNTVKAILQEMGKAEQ